MAHTVECLACGHIGAAKTKGSFVITLVLLVVGFILAGVVYEIWRRSGGKVCSACGSNQIRLYKPTQKHALPMNNTQLQQIQCPYCREDIRFDARKCKHCGSEIK